LCCELRGLGMEVTLGKLVDSFEPLGDKACAQPVAEAPKTLEEEYQVSSVDKLEADGFKILEIPAGDYVPNHRPPQAPIITSVTNGKNGLKPRVEISQEPLIDDIDEPAAEESLVDAFVDRETSDIFTTGFELETAHAIIDETKLPKGGDEGATAAPDVVAPDESLISAGLKRATQDSFFNDFPSLSELQSLASELLSLSLPDETIAVGAKAGADSEGEDPLNDGNFSMDDEES
jgi:hypothetical protein